MPYPLETGGYEPKYISTIGELVNLPATTKMIYPNVGCNITSLYKLGDDTTNWADSDHMNIAGLLFSADNQFPIVCADGDFWAKCEISAGTFFAAKI